MEPNFGQWYIEAALDPTDERLKKRWEGVVAFVAALQAADIPSLIKAFRDLDAPEEFLIRFRKFFLDADSLFPAAGNELEIQVLAGASLIHVFATAKTGLMIEAALLTLCCDFEQLSKSTALQEVTLRARTALTQQSARYRADSIRDSAAPTPLTPEQIQAVAGATDHLTLAASSKIGFEAMGKAIAALQARLQTIAAANNFLLEESNILWWVFGGHCNHLDTPIADVPSDIAPFWAAKDLAAVTLHSPGPVSAASFLAKALQGVRKLPATVQVNKAITAMNKVTATQFLKSASAHPLLELCPVHLALARGCETGDFGQAYADVGKRFSIKEDAKLPPWQLSRQTYRECLLLFAR